MLKKLLIVLTAISLTVIVSSCGKTPEESLSSAVLSAERGNWKQCRKHAENTLSAYPDHVGALLLRAIACQELGESDHAIDSAERAVKLNPESFASLYTLGRIYYSSALRKNEAVSPLLRAYNLNPKHTGTLILLCNTLIEINPTQALAFLKLLNSQPDFTDKTRLSNQFAVAYAKAGHLAQAQQMFNRAYNLSPTDPDIIFNAGRFYDKYSHNRNIALKLYQECVAKSGGDPQYSAISELANARIKNL